MIRRVHSILNLVPGTILLGSPFIFTFGWTYVGWLVTGVAKAYLITFTLAWHVEYAFANPGIALWALAVVLGSVAVLAVMSVDTTPRRPETPPAAERRVVDYDHPVYPLRGEDVEETFQRIMRTWPNGRPPFAVTLSARERRIRQPGPRQRAVIASWNLGHQPDQLPF